MLLIVDVARPRLYSSFLSVLVVCSQRLFFRMVCLATHVDQARIAAWCVFGGGDVQQGIVSASGSGNFVPRLAAAVSIAVGRADSGKIRYHVGDVAARFFRMDAAAATPFAVVFDLAGPSLKCGCEEFWPWRLQRHIETCACYRALIGAQDAAGTPQTPGTAGYLYHCKGASRDHLLCSTASSHPSLMPPSRFPFHRPKEHTNFSLEGEYMELELPTSL